MGEIDTFTRHSFARRLAGWIAATLAASITVLTVLGTWNPFDLVVLWRFFGNPMRGAALACTLALAASWLLAPVRSEAAQPGRARWRIAFGLGLFASLVGLGLFGNRFSTDHQRLATSGDRAIVLYEPGTDFQRLHVWAGHGLGARHVGDLGKPCGSTTVSFVTADQIRVATAYGTFDLRLDPDTGEPLNTLGATCSG